MGEDHINAKMTEDLAQQILDSKDIKMTMVQRMEKFGVNSRRIGSVLSRRTWKHLQPKRKAPVASEDETNDPTKRRKLGTPENDESKVL